MTRKPARHCFRVSAKVRKNPLRRIAGRVCELLQTAMNGIKLSGLRRKCLPPPENPGCFQRFDEFLGGAPGQPRYDRLPVRVTDPDSPPAPSAPQQDRLDVPKRHLQWIGTRMSASAFSHRLPQPWRLWGEESRTGPPRNRFV